MPSSCLQESYPYRLDTAHVLTPRTGYSPYHEHFAPTRSRLPSTPRSRACVA
ncbi:hypothetical protein FOMPIDRAFT_1036070 [Fomitopsis schrenkii]|uniref:Uncharacterized protein n=1 Tax=Fomitopsis schrenkii TaxID=2126942 RepID=S8EAK7_FOMSC|nr:hypothetical protein FOMPIDRAFT_1036070 [Fomitopsis schrenkii]